MSLDGCGQLCKYVIILFNILFALVGFALLGLGLWLRFSDNTRGFFQIEELNTSAFVIGVTVLIVLGSVMLIVVAFGDYGTCHENICALQVFSGLLGVLAGALIAAGVLAYTRSDNIAAQLTEFYVSMYALYASSGDPGTAVTLTFFHNVFHCCGVSGVPILDLAKSTCPTPDGMWEKLIMKPCPGVIASVFESKAPLVMGTFLGTGALLITALVCTAILTKQIKRSQQEVIAHYSAVY
ncbi:CD9 antigen isoform 2-T2 [Polymixia lowei]